MAKTATEEAINKIQTGYPEVNAEGKKELENVTVQFDLFEKQMRALSESSSPIVETEQQTKLSSREVNSMDAPVIKPFRTIGSKEKFNENFRAQYDYAKQYVKAIAENNEIKGETIELWTKPFPGVPAEFWKVPVNKPVMIPRYLASQLNTRIYNQYIQEDKNYKTGTEGGHQFYTGIVSKQTVHRLDCRPAANAMYSMFTG